MGTTKNPGESSVAASLVERIASGDQKAEASMVDRYQRGLIAMLFNRSRDKALAEEIAQETWLLVLNKIRNGELRKPETLARFIVQIGRNQLIMHYRALAKRTFVSDDDVAELQDDSPTPEEGAEIRQFGESVHALLSNMSIDRDSELLRRFYLVGDSKRELCADFKLSENHFDRVLYRARERFKNLWMDKVGAGK